MIKWLKILKKANHICAISKTEGKFVCVWNETGKKKIIENRSHRCSVVFNQLSKLRMVWKLLPVMFILIKYMLSIASLYIYIYIIYYIYFIYIYYIYIYFIYIIYIYLIIYHILYIYILYIYIIYISNNLYCRVVGKVFPILFNFKTARKKRFFNEATSNWFLYVSM